MLRQAGSHAVHVVMEAVIGVIGLLAVVACIVAWRLAQGPIDVTWLVRREQGLLTGGGAALSVGHAELAWEGYHNRDRPMDFRVRDVALTAPGGHVMARVPSARVTLALGQLLVGRVVPRTVEIDGADVEMRRSPDGRLHLNLDDKAPAVAPQSADNAPGAEALVQELVRPARLGDDLPWLSQLVHVQIVDASVTLNDAMLGVIWQAPHTAIDLKRMPDGGVAGHARLELAVGDVHATLTMDTKLTKDGSLVTASTTPISPAALARVAPQFAALAALDAPIEAKLEAALDPDLGPRDARLTMNVGPGTVLSGKNRIGLKDATATAILDKSELKLEAMRVRLAQPPGTAAPPPVFSGTANATLSAGRVHARFGLDIDAVQIEDLGKYWPPGVGGGARSWLVENITAGRAHDAHVSGTLEAAADFSDVQLTALQGGFSADDLTVFWLRPIPGVQHGHAVVTIDSPDALTVTMDRGEQNQLRVDPGSSIIISGLMAKDQIGDLTVKMSGPLSDALALLNHPRLKLLSKSKVDISDSAGSVQATLQMRIPLDDKVTMDEIQTHATANLRDVHLGGIAAGRDLDRGQLVAKVTGDGLSVSGTGDFAGIPAKLGLEMDFRAGPAKQVLQHLTANGTATTPQLVKAGLPAAVAGEITSGTTGLQLDYSERRDNTAALQVDADFAAAAIATPVGWAKAAGPAATAHAHVLLDHGQLMSINDLTAKGPGLVIESRAQLDKARGNSLLLDRLELGATRAHGRVDFPSSPNGALKVALSGAMLDLSSYLDKPASKPGATAPSETATDKDKPGKAWAANLAFEDVRLARGRELAAFKLNAASDGLRILHADARAGTDGELAARVTPEGNGRVVSIRAADAGDVLIAAGIADNLHGGRLQLDGRYDDTLPGHPLSGTAVLNEFQIKSAPAIGKLLQAMTLYGVADVLRGPGLHFTKMVAPFKWERRVLTLSNARAFSSSLGLTAQGSLDLRRHIADIHGTVVPAYFFNQLLGNLPLIGKVFSPEKGGGVFAARYSVTGKLADPKVGVNPLSALTPGFLRNVFGLLAPAPAK